MSRLIQPRRDSCLLDAAAVRQRQHDEAERLAICSRLAVRLRLIPGLGYGSLVKPNRFTRHSDVDVAVESLPDGVSLYLLQSLLSEAAGREVDVCLLGETRFREQIVKLGEKWI